jgi:RNA polymerase sigma factor (sigma-70 family)
MLSEKRREVMIMKYYEGQTEKQIAENLKISVYTVEERLEEAKKELRRKLRNE